MNTNNRLKVGTITLFIIMFIFIAFTNSQAAAVSKTTTPKTTTPTTTTSGTNTYYIDYVRGSDANSGKSSTTPWKLCPGMKGFVGKYTHQAGDTFIFKSSVTWPSSVLPLTIRYSGSSGKIDTYKGDSTTMPPVFDGGGAVNNLIFASKKSYFNIEGIKMINAGLPNIANKKYGFQIEHCMDFKISKCTLKPETWLGIYIRASSGTYSNINILDNDISGAAMGIVVATSAANTIIDNVVIAGNKIHDFTSQIGGGIHGDGIHLWGSPNSDITQYISNLKIYNNSFYGSFARSFGTKGGMTAFIYFEGATQGAEIYNNTMSYTDKPTKENIFEAMITLSGITGRGGSHNVHDNTATGTNPGMSAGIRLVAAPNCTINKNIFSGMKYVYNIDTTSITGAKINHNTANYADQYDKVGIWGGAFKTWPKWQALGNDINGTNQKP